MFWLRQFFWWSFPFVTIIWFHESETLFPKIIDIDHYLQMESEMISKGRIYLSQERYRLKILKTHLKAWGKWRKSYLNQESEYTTIPQNIFHLFKKLVLDLDQLEEIMMANSYNGTMTPNAFELSTENHLKQIVSSLVHLQDLYDLTSNEIMNGELMGVQLNTSLAIDSCHFIGKTCVEYNKHSCSTDWLNLWLSEPPDDPDLRKEVIKSIYASYIFLDQKELAFNYTSKYLKEDPYDISARDALLDLAFTIGKLNKINMDYLETNRLCRGDYDTRSHTIRSNLRCRYKRGDSAFLKIAPLKEEDLHDNPKLLLYKDAIHDSEIELMKSCPYKYFRTAGVLGKDGSNKTSFKYRVGQIAYVDRRSPAFTMLSERIEDISDLSIDSGEPWQLLSYSPGGHYTMHSDYLHSHLEDVQIYGNRVATMLFYFNDVVLGGETVFTRIGLPVKPIKGAAIIWYNVYSDGSENTMVKHSACPVIIGEKWGFTQWFRAKNQITLSRIFDTDSITSWEFIKTLRKLKYEEIKRKRDEF